jgi:RNA polymerase sigma-70 factor (ECF subfamily)
VDAAERERLEHQLRAHFDEGDLAAAATLAIRGYGPEIYGFLIGMAGDEDTAAEAFSMFCVELWRDLARFRWECSLRTWAYMVARHRLYRLAGARDRRRREVAADDAPEIARLVEQVRSSTARHLRTAVKDQFTALRERLDADDQMLLVLRVDKDLDWLEIARVLGGADREAVALTRDAATLRKRFERVKQRLRALAREAGLMPPEP